MTVTLEDPYYAKAFPEISQEHGCQLLMHHYVAAIKLNSSWAVPAGDNIALVAANGVVDVLLGSALWNPDYGYFKITGFVLDSYQIWIQRIDHASTAPVGTVIPVNTKFILTVPPV